MRRSLVLHLHVAGQVIRTTGEHPFWVDGRGWVPAGGLACGDLLLGGGGERLAVEDVSPTGEVETVYNLRVADSHTYFVGCDEWGFAAWAHNVACKEYYISTDDSSPAMYTVYEKATGLKARVLPGAATTALKAGTTVSQADPGAVMNFLNQTNNYKAFGLGLDAKGQANVGKNPAKIDSWGDQIKGQDARDVLSKADAIKEFEAFQAADPNFFSDLHVDPANPGGPQRTGADLTGTSGFPASDKARSFFIHAHHIVMKTGGVLPSSQARQLLRTVGIDPYYGTENLAWEPNWQNHKQGIPYPTHVWQDLATLTIPVNLNPTAASVAAISAQKVLVVDKLKEIAGLFFRADYPM